MIREPSDALIAALPRAGTRGKEMLYTVPLDADREAYLWLPKRLGSEDAIRMEKFIAALVIEDEDDA